ncbi:MAG: hypothetical protein RBU37_03965 [Myxococcota bacterium]|nr:hypothetical protein [Myxococcota bacterium]
MIRNVLLFLSLSLAALGCNTFFDPSSIEPSGLPTDTGDTDQSVDLDQNTDQVPDELVTCDGRQCAAGEICCPVPPFMIETCLSSSLQYNCGACGVICGIGERCEDGKCVCGEQSSEGSAVCSFGQQCCKDGSCADTCPCGSEVCSGSAECCNDTYCADLSRDRENCGTCGQACGEDQLCSDYQCVCADSGSKLCGEVCIDIMQDVNNCGDCNKKCSTFRGTSSCNAGVCTMDCNEGYGDCDLDPDNGCEANLNTSLDHCGGCNQFCSNYNAVAQCNAGECRLTCNGNAGDCDEDTSTGCEADFTGDLFNCGGCNQACPDNTMCMDSVCMCADNACPPTGEHHDSATCSEGGTCQFACEGDWENCDGEGANGCEADLMNDADTCGSCETQCGPGGSCINGECDEIVKLSAGGAHICVLREGGAVLCWGANAKGQIGNDATGSQPLPLLIDIDDGATILDVAAGKLHSCAVTDENEVFCWGDNSERQLGCSSSTGFFKVPCAVQNTGSGGTDNAITKVTAGLHHSCGITTDQAVYCWGDNQYGQLGNGTSTDSSLPVRVTFGSGIKLVAISAGDWHTCAIDEDQQVWCWGRNDLGQIGSNESFTTILSPSQVVNSADEPLSGVSYVSAGRTHACAVVTGHIYCWGNNLDGQLGLGSSGGSVSYAQAVDHTMVYQFVGTGDDHSCGISSTGAAFCWGFNASGQLGNNSTSAVDTPSPVNAGQGLNGASLIDGGSAYTCARHNSSGLLYCWGDGDSGQLGAGTYGASLLPQLVAGIP